MRCPTCKSDVDGTNGYCNRCGTSLTARLCPRGHLMDPSWAECRYCSPQGGAGNAAPGSKGRTVVENPGPRPGGFIAGATLLEGGLPGKGATVVERGGGSGAFSGAKPPGGKAATVFDPGPAGQVAGATPRGPRPRLAGWLVSFSTDPSGDDFRLHEGRNVIGSDASECEVALPGEASVSGKHAVVIFRDGVFQVRDNDSTNGTYVNGEDIFGKGAVVLKNLDRLRIGKVDFVLYAIQP